MWACGAVAKNSIFLLVLSIFVGKDRDGMKTCKWGKGFFGGKRGNG
jgi:hypothetical protein